MPTREERTLKLVKGTGGAAPRQVTRRRAVVRRVPRIEEDPVELLGRLDEEPVLESPPVPRRRPHWSAVAACAVLAVALAAAAFGGYRWYGDRALDEAHEAALAAARQTAVNFVSVSASSVDRDLQRIVAGATGEFKDEFVRGQGQVRAAIVENKVESTGTVLRAGLVSGDRRSAVVLVAVDATVKNVKAPDGRPSHYRIQVDVTRTGGAWLVSRLQFVG
jgi:Mce-associated membrane protein